MDAVLVVLGLVLVVVAFADLVNTLVTTSTSYARAWPTRMVWTVLYGVVRRVAARLPERSPVRERLLAVFGPLLLIILLAMWIVLQVIGFGLVWWATSGIEASGFVESVYYSGVVFFTIGFGELVPTAAVPRLGALVEAGAGVITTALVIGYLPALYAAYSDRERMLMTLDHASSERISPVSLVKAWSPDADPAKLEQRFQEWERWVAGVLETHATLPLLRLFRSHDPQQHWITALGVVTDAALLTQQIVGAYDGHGYWLIRRSTALFDEMTRFVPEDRLQPYREARADRLANSDQEFFRKGRAALRAHGFELLPEVMAQEHTRQLRDGYGPHMEYLIDYLLAPRGFWSPDRIDVPLLSTTHPEVLHLQPDDLDDPVDDPADAMGPE